MKNITLLSAVLFTSGLSFAQLSQSEEPALGDNITLYVIDSNAVDYEAVTGSGVTWDYSNYGIYGNDPKLVENLDASTTNNASDFPNSVAALKFEDGLTRYSSSTATENSSQGFVFNEVNFGEVRLELDTDEAKLANYPMNLGDVVADTYQGTLYYSYSGIAQSPTANGTLLTTYDGVGTLKLADGNDFTNVHRFKSIDTVEAAGPLPGSVIQLVRNQYDYYDYTQSKLPVFTSVYFRVSLGSAVLTETKVVMSSVLPTGFVGIDDEACNTCVNKVFPNPAKEVLNVNVAENASVVIYSMTGQEVTRKNVKQGTQTKFDISGFKQGVYLVKIEGEKTTKIERVVVH